MIYLMLSSEIIFIKPCIFGISNSFSRTKPPGVRPASQQAFNSKDHTKEAPPPHEATPALAWGQGSCAPTCPRQRVPPGHPPSTLGAGAKTHVPEKTVCPRAQPAPEVQGQPQTTVCSPETARLRGQRLSARWPLGVTTRRGAQAPGAPEPGSDDLQG